MERLKPYLRSAAGMLGGLLLLLLLLFGLTRSGVTLLKQLQPEDARLSEARLEEAVKDARFYGRARRIIFVVGYGLGAGCLLALTVGLFRRLSTQSFKLGEHREIKVRYRDMSRVGFIAESLIVAEQLDSKAQAREQAFEMYLQLNQAITSQLRALPAGQALSGTRPQAALPSPPATVPSFAELLQGGEIAPGKPLILGYHQGRPEYRDIQALKSLAITGWQGSGKTVSMAYMIASASLAYHTKTYVVDPHHGHDKGLYNLIQPLEAKGAVQVVNPFDTPTLIRELNGTLNRRLRGDESSSQGILLVIDELARLARLDCFDELIHFLERCTEETRKANITFIGGSQKWTARHFKGRADIRACMNSALVHKTKPSQAELLLEDSQDKKMVKRLQRPGDAILVTDFADARLVSMPFCTRADIEQLARRIEGPAIALQEQGFPAPAPPHFPNTEPERRTETELDRELNAILALPEQGAAPLPDLSTEDLLRARTQELLKDGAISYGKINTETGIAKSTANAFVNAGKSLKPEQKRALRDYLERLERDAKTPVEQA